MVLNNGHNTACYLTICSQMADKAERYYNIISWI